MALARVVTFDGVSKDRMEEMDREMNEGQPPEGFPAAELIALHDPDAEKSLVNGSRFHPLQRSRRLIPASSAIRSNSAGHAYRKGIEVRSSLPSTISK